MFSQADEKRAIAATGFSGMVGGRARELGHERPWEALAVDITNSSAVEAAVEATSASTIVNFAAYTDTAGAWKQRGDEDGPCFRVNVDGARNLARACAQTGKHLVQISTDYVFEGEREQPYVESDEGDAHTDWYGFTKRVAEDYVKESGAKWSIARLSFPFLRQSVRKTDIVRRIGAQLQSGAIPPMFDDQTVTPSFTDDAVHMITNIAAFSLPGVFHVVGPEWLSPYKIAVSVADRLGLSRSIVTRGSLADFNARDGRKFPMTLKIGGEATRRVLGTPARTLNEALLLPGWSF